MSAIAVLDRTHDQRMVALQLANETRFARADLKFRIRVGLTTAEEVLADPPVWAATMKVTTLLHAIPMFGPVKTRTLLRRAQIADSKTVGGLSERQRRLLIELIEAAR